MPQYRTLFKCCDNNTVVCRRIKTVSNRIERWHAIYLTRNKFCYYNFNTLPDSYATGCKYEIVTFKNVNRFLDESVMKL